MTLREEIKAICQGLNYEVTMQSCDEETDQILKLFEKLIDEKIANSPNTVLKVEEMGLIEANRDRYSSLEVLDIVIGILQELKEELEK